MKTKPQPPANPVRAWRLPFPTLCATLAAITLVHASPLAAQGAVWTGGVGEWNDSAQWDGGVVPGETTNVFLPAAAVVSYNLPMAAASIGGLTNWGLLSINTSGFNCAAVVLNRVGGGGLLTVNSGGVLAITGALGICSNNAVTIQPGASLTASAAVHIGSNPFGVVGGATIGAFGRMTNNGGVITTATTTFNPNNQSLAAGNHALLVINGGVNNLGSVDIHRSGGTAQAALGTEGLMIYGGLVNMTSLRLGNNNFASMLVSPGAIVTNTGNGTIRNTTAGRPSRLLQTGGLYVTLGTQTMTVSTGTGAGTTYSITGGTNLMGGLRFGDTATAANPGTANFTNAAAIYIGLQGIANSGAAVVNARLNPGGLFGALADWTGSSPMILGAGDFTFRAASLDGTPHNITLDGVLSGIGPLVKTGGGTLTMSAAHTYTGPTLINEGTLALG
ncbi:MAG TPA: autotransporter-associated beta strand repeat-containing protein, partial [Candidatus Omnitrophota bacterium]|nr:autotransporter-associated beta strand repeat-containing protein [Candidatus Omnitrophota bacterium]